MTPPKVIRGHHFWTFDHTKCWYEWILDVQGNIVAVGAFGGYRQEAIRNATKLMKAEYPTVHMLVAEEVL